MADERIPSCGTWTLNKNDKGNNPRRPDYRGEVIIEGKSYVIAGWIRTVKGSEKKFISGTVTPKAPRAVPPPAEADSGGFSANTEGEGQDDGGFHV